MKTKPPAMTTRIGPHDVPLRLGKGPRIVRFAEGTYAFWTAVFKNRVGGRWRIIGRALVGLSAGDRFDRMKVERKAAWIPKEDHAVYQEMWEMMGGGANVKLVRPSTEKEFKRWADKHPEQMETAL